jgi:hypothetical protein
MEWVLKHSRSAGAARLVALAIAYHVDKDGQPAYPSTETIAQFANLHRSSVFPCLDRLKKIGELDWIQGGGRNRTNLYSLKLFAQQSSLFGSVNSRPSRPNKQSPSPINSRPQPSKQSPSPDTNRIEPNIEPAGGEKTRRAPRAEDSRLAVFFQFAFESFKAKHGDHAPSWNGKDRRQLSELLKVHPDLSFEEMRRRWTFFISSTDSWIQKQGDSLAFFCSNFDRFIDGPLAAAPAGGKNGNNKLTIAEQAQRTRRLCTAAGF